MVGPLCKIHLFYPVHYYFQVLYTDTFLFFPNIFLTNCFLLLNTVIDAWEWYAAVIGQDLISLCSFLKNKYSFWSFFFFLTIVSKLVEEKNCVKESTLKVRFLFKLHNISNTGELTSLNSNVLTPLKFKPSLRHILSFVFIQDLVPHTSRLVHKFR